MAKHVKDAAKRITAAAKERVQRERDHSGLLGLLDRRVTQTEKHLDTCVPLALAASKRGDELPGLALLVLARAVWALQAVRRLFVAGFDLDALSALRTIPELLIDLKFIRLDSEERVELFSNFVYVSNWRRYEQLSKHLTFIADSEPASVTAGKRSPHRG